MHKIYFQISLAVLLLANFLISSYSSNYAAIFSLIIIYLAQLVYYILNRNKLVVIETFENYLLSKNIILFLLRKKKIIYSNTKEPGYNNFLSIIKDLSNDQTYEDILNNITNKLTKDIVAVGNNHVISKFTFHNMGLYQVIIIEKHFEKRIVDILSSLKIPVFVSNNKEIIASSPLISQDKLKELREYIASEDLVKTFINDTYITLSDEIINQDNVKLCSIQFFSGCGTLWNFIKHSSIASAVLDPEFRIILCNRHFSKIMNSDSLVGESFLNFVRSDERNSVIQLALERVAKKIFTHLELNINNTESIIHLHINSVDINGKLFYIFTIIDTTKYKTMEMNFIHSQKMQAIGQLSGAIAHDFNNLLTAMMGFCDLLLLKHPPGDRSFSDLMQIKQNVNRAANLVRQLLAFSRKQVMQPKVIDITNILAELSHLICRLIGENINFDIQHGQDIDLIKVDQGQFEQVIVNLVVNARDAMPNGGSLTISTSNILVDDNFSEDDFYVPVGDDPIIPGKYVLIKVQDTGHGIPDELLDKIFNPFFSTKAIGSGTGLGLSTVYGIIKQTNGYIRVQTSKEGSLFYMFLKSYEENSEIAENISQEDIAQPEKLFVKDISKHGSILIVEDETTVRTFSVHALSNKGYKVLQADCAETALTVIEEQGDDIELVISDIMMPGMTGPKMVEKIHVKYPDMKIIFMSGYAEDTLSDYNFAHINFLAKPFTLKQLTSKVQEVIFGNND